MPSSRFRASRLLTLASCLALGLGSAHAAPPPGPERAATLPFVSPDGKHIVYTRDLPDHSAELIVIEASGTNPRTLVRDTSGSVMGGWLGKDVAYVLHAGDTTIVCRVPVTGGTPSVRRLRLVGKSTRVSNDGRKVAYTVGGWTRGRLMVATADGRHARAITDSTAGWFNTAWSPDDKRIAVTRLDSTRALGVWVMDADGANARALAAFPDSVGRAQWPTWSPDGRSIAIQVGRYDRDDHAKDRADIWVVDVTSGRATNLMPADDPWIDETPSWAPDGTIVFQSTRSGRFELWRMNADGSGAVQLTR